MKKWAQATLIALSSAFFVIPTSAIAVSPNPKSTDMVATTPQTIQVLQFKNLASRDYTDSKRIKINSPRIITVHVTQKSKLSSITPTLTYRILSANGDNGSIASYGYGRFVGKGSFTFTSKKELPAGEYYIRARNTRTGRAVGTVSVTIP